MADLPPSAARILPDKALEPCDGREDTIYHPLSSSGLHFRLLKILPTRDGELCCSIRQASLEEPPKYTALSYTWGSPEDQKYNITLNRRPFVVRQNLYDLLKRLQGEPEASSAWWIDAISIDQQNNSERTYQVGLMRLIYERASSVLVWLGPSQDGSDEVMRWINSMYEHRSDEDWLWQQFLASSAMKILLDLYKLLQRPYWNRIWIVQEIVCAREILLCCGQESAPAEALEFVQRTFNDLQREGLYICNVLFPSIGAEPITISWKGIRPMWNSRMRRSRSKLRIFDALRYHITKLSTDPRDKIYGLMGLRNAEEPGINIDYDCTPAQVYTSYFKYEVQTTKKLDVLTFASAASRKKQDSLQAPSWVPDWTFHRAGHARLLSILEPHFQFAAAGSSEAAASFDDSNLTLTVRGFQVGHVAAIGKATNMSHGDDDARALTAFLQWSEHLFDKSSLDDVTKEVSIARSLLANRFRAEEYEDFGRDVTEADFLRGLLGAWAEEVRTMFPDEQLHRHLKSCLQFNKSHFDDSAAHTRIWRLWVKDSMRYVLDRRLFVSSNGEFGIAPDETDVDDIVCVVLGCPLPMVFRRLQDGYTVIGYAYLDGWMHGKALTLHEENVIDTQDFVLI